MATLQWPVHGSPVRLRDPQRLEAGGLWLAWVAGASGQGDPVGCTGDINAARNILQCMYDDGIDLYMPFKAVKALLREQTWTTDGTAHPGLEPAAPTG